MLLAETACTAGGAQELVLVGLHDGSFKSQ